MARRVALVALVLAIVAGPAGADTITEKKQSVDARIAALDERVASTRAREGAIRAEVASFSAQIRDLTTQVGDVSARLGPLEQELALRRERLRKIERIYQLQTRRLHLLQRQHTVALQRLAGRLVDLYQQDEMDSLSLLLAAKSFTDLLDKVDYLQRIAAGDRRIADEVGAAKERVRAQRAETRATRRGQRQEVRVVALRTAQVRALRDRLVANRADLAGARAARKETLASLTQAEREDLGEMEALQAVSAALQAKIQAAQASSGTGGGTPSAAGLIWPVIGPVTSPFGTRWGRMHEGIDIGVPEGTAIRAAASGTVIYAGWMGGYGNLVVIDHGNGLATAYGHQSSIAVGYGQSVSQGQTIGYVGSTGHSTGPHLHFEVRVNGVPVDPLGYL
jgi:murein DD-endopeptidase MepM/ murein hydrolase activator NlpD